MDDNKFKELVEEALKSLPSEFSEMIDNVAVTIEDYPSDEQRKKLNLPPYALLFGLYEGVPKTQRLNYSGAIPDKITIFKQSILRVSRTEEEIKAQVRATVIHEIGHHFGLSDRQLK